jgi:prophage regulatory protein
MNKAAPAVTRDRIVGMSDVLPMFGSVSRSTLYRWIKEGRFPRQVKMGPQRIGFIQSELDDFVEKLRAERLLRDARRETEAA